VQKPIRNVGLPPVNLMNTEPARIFADDKKVTPSDFPLSGAAVVFSSIGVDSKSKGIGVFNGVASNQPVRCHVMNISTFCSLQQQNSYQ
jgi:hypothetical protein